MLLDFSFKILTLIPKPEGVSRILDKIKVYDTKKFENWSRVRSSKINVCAAGLINMACREYLDMIKKSIQMYYESHP